MSVKITGAAVQVRMSTSVVGPQAGQQTSLQPRFQAAAQEAATRLFAAMTGTPQASGAAPLPGAQGRAGAMMGVVNNPAQVLMSQGNAALQAAAFGRATGTLSPQSQQALQMMGLGMLAAGQQMSFVNHLGQMTAAMASTMPPGVVGQQMLGVAGANPQFLNAAGAHVMNNAFDQQATAALGSQYMQTLGSQQPAHWGRQTLSSIGPQYFNNFDQRTLGAIPDRGLTQYGQQLMGSIGGMSPFNVGQSLLGEVNGQLRQQLGGALLGGAPAGVQQDVGKALMGALTGNPLAAGESLLRSLGTKTLSKLGGQLFKGLPGLDKLGPQALANKLAGAVFQKGNVGKNLLGALKDFGVSKLKSFGKDMLSKFGKPLLKKVGGNVLNWVKDSALGKIGKGLMDKVGGKVLDKLGGVGKIAGGVLSALNGKFDTKKMLQIGMNFIPVIGPALGVLSSIPGVGKIFDKVLGGVAKVLDKIPIVGDVLKGVGKVVGKVGEGVKKVVGGVVDGVKKVGKAIGSGIKKVFSKW